MPKNAMYQFGTNAANFLISIYIWQQVKHDDYWRPNISARIFPNDTFEIYI
jgi:hypothetical protein